MATLDVTARSVKGRRKMRIEIDMEKFERLAADPGFFNPAFLGSLERAERDSRSKRLKRISSLKDLRIRDDRRSRD